MKKKKANKKRSNKAQRDIKDFLYESNDVIVTLIIIAIVAVIIVWRVKVIMDYPEKLAASAKSTATVEEMKEDKKTSNTAESKANSVKDKQTTSASSDTSDQTDDESDSSGSSDSDSKSDSESTSKATTTIVEFQSQINSIFDKYGDLAAAQTKLYNSNNQLISNLSITIPSGNTSKIEEYLVEQHVFDDTKDIESYCSKANTSASKIKPGSYTFAKGTNKSDIIKKITD